MEERRKSARKVDPLQARPREPEPIAPAPERDDPYGRQVFFSDAPNMTAEAGSGRIRAECSACGTTRRMTLPDVIRAHFPVWAWVPVLHSPHWMRCPSCSRRTWIRLTPALGAE